MEKADTIIYDRLISRKLLTYAREDAELIYVGKKAGEHALAQEKINRLLVEKASQNRVVVRLKGGDPFIFGRGAEEISALVEEGVEFEVVPGVSSAVAVPELSCIPLTHREFSSSVAIVTGHAAVGDEGKIDYSRLGTDTVVILMGISALESIVPELLKARARDTPVAIIEKGSTEAERIITGTLGDIVEKAGKYKISPPAITVVGEVVRLRESWKGGMDIC